jgi:hypothetical protein
MSWSQSAMTAAHPMLSRGLQLAMFSILALKYKMLFSRDAGKMRGLYTLAYSQIATKASLFLILETLNIDLATG